MSIDSPEGIGMGTAVEKKGGNNFLKRILLRARTPAFKSQGSHTDNLSQPLAEHSHTEPLHLLPDDLFVHDEKAESQRPKLLKDIPYCNFDNFLNTLPLAVRLGEITKLQVLNSVESGAEGIVFRLQAGKEDMAIKLFFGAGLSQEDFEKMLQLSQADITLIATSKRHVNKEFDSKVSRKVLMEAGGHVAGNAIAPEYVNKPLKILTHNGNPVGVVHKFIEGTPRIPANINQLKPSMDQLTSSGVLVDEFGINVIQHSENSNKYTLIDLGLNNAHLLNQSPQSFLSSFSLL